MSEPARTSNAMEVCLGILGEIEVDDNVHGLDIDTASKKIRTHQVAADTISEIVENAVAVVLEHLCMRVETGVSELRDLFGQ